MLPRDTEKNETDTNTNKCGTTIAGQLLSFFSGGIAGSVAYNTYHALSGSSQESSTPKPK